MLFRTFDGLTKAQRIRTFETIWSRVKTRHWDASKVGAKWDAVRKVYRPRVEPEQTNRAFYLLMSQIMYKHQQVKMKLTHLQLMGLLTHMLLMYHQMLQDKLLLIHYL